MVIDAPASAPFEHVKSFALPPHVDMPIDLAIASDGTVFVADGGQIRAVDAVDAGGDQVQRTLRPAAVPDVLTAVVPMAIEHDPATGELEIVWQEYGTPAGATEPRFARAWIERRAAGGGTARKPALIPGDGRVSDLAAHTPTGDHYLARGGSIFRLESGTAKAVATLPITYTADATARIALSDEHLVLVSGGVARIHRIDGTPLGDLDLEGHAAAAIGRRPDGGFGVLLTMGGAVIDATTPVVLAYDADGTRSPAGDLTVADVGLAPVPSNDWPWAIAYSGTHAAFITATRNGLFAVRRLGPSELTLMSASDPDPSRSFPQFVPPSFEPDLIGTVERLEGVVVTAGAGGAGGGVLVAGCRPVELGDVSNGGCATRGAIAYRLTEKDGFRDGRTLGPGLSDLAAGDGGAIFAGYAGARFVDGGEPSFHRPGVERLGAAWEAPEWVEECDCEYGGRIARAGDNVFSVEPATGEAVGRDMATGAVVRRIAAPGPAAGTWPADLTSDGAGRLFAASTGRRVIERWSSGDDPDLAWTAGAGIGFGPRRIALGEWNGTPVIASLASDGRVELHNAESGDLVLFWHPARADGTLIGAKDLAFDDAGRLYLIDGEGGDIEIFAPVAGPWEPPGPTPGPSPTPPPSACIVSGDKTAGPRRVALGDTATITLTLRAECPPREDHVGADIVLAIMVGQELRGMRGAHDAMAFVESWLGLVDTTLHRIGVTTVEAYRNPVIIPLGTAPRDILRRLTSFGRHWFGVNRAEPVEFAYDHLHESKRPGALPIIVYVDATSTRMNTTERRNIRHAGERARGEGMLTYAIGLHGDRPWLREYAGADERTFVQPEVHETAAIMAHIMREAGSSLSGNLVVDDTMSDDVFYESGSAIPRAMEASGASDLRWTRAVLPSTGMTMTFRVAPLRTGIIPTNRVAVARYDDVDGARRELVYPIPEIEVFVPTPTITPSPTHTSEPTPPPNPTRIPEAIYMPIAVRAASVY